MEKIERNKLTNEFKRLIEPGFKTIEDIIEIEDRGGEILQKLIDDDILNELLKNTTDENI